MSDATLTRLIRPTIAATCRPDKAFTPHPAIRRKAR
ncbi:mannitol-1-phosphate 5-dehydrogenase [Escherichia coli]|nr:mannitol-1-phosphate 5-dehydrogenase [Escherichia coli]